MKVTPELVEKYYRNLCTPAEQKAVELWQENIDSDDEVILPEGENKQLHKEQIWNPLAAILQAEKNKFENEADQQKKQVNSYFYFWRIAACLAIGITAFLYFSQTRRTNAEKIAVSYKTIRTRKGEKVTFTLTDGTVINLNSQSEIKYPENFTDTSRIICLIGEAHFKVAKDKSRPFSIYAANTMTRVLGTVFNLKVYPKENAVLSVQEGCVRFGGINDSLPHQKYTVNESGTYSANNKLSKVSRSVLSDVAWTKSKIVFADQTLKEIVPVIERWYNVSIQVNNSNLLQKKLTGEFNNPSINALMDRLGYVMRFKYHISNNQITIN